MDIIHSTQRFWKVLQQDKELNRLLKQFSNQYPKDQIWLQTSHFLKLIFIQSYYEIFQIVRNVFTAHLHIYHLDSTINILLFFDGFRFKSV